MADGKFYSDVQVRNWHAYHPPVSEAVRDAHEQVREMFADLNVKLNNLLPEGPDKSVALRAVRDAMMQANGCLAVAGKVYGQEDTRPTLPTPDAVKNLSAEEAAALVKKIDK